MPMPRPLSKTDCTCATWRKVAVGIAVVWSCSTSLLGGCASSSDRRAEARQEDLRPSEVARSRAATTEGPQPLAPWRSAAAPTATVVLRGSTASFQLFVNGTGDGVANEMRIQTDIHPQDWVQAGAPPLTTLDRGAVAAVEVERGTQTVAPLVVRNRVEAISLPSGRHFVSLSVAVQAPKSSTAEPQINRRVLASTAAAATGIEAAPGGVGALTREAVLEPGANKTLIVTTSAPPYAVREWTRWVKTAVARGSEISLWSRTPPVDFDALRSLASEGHGQLWIGGTPEAVMHAWRDQPMATLKHPTLQLKFDAHIVRRHRVIGSTVSRSRHNHPSRWRLSTVYSVLVEVDLQPGALSDLGPGAANVDTVTGRATAVFEGANSRVHRAEIPLPSLGAFGPTNEATPVAMRQIALGLAAENLRGRALAPEDQDHLLQVELDPIPRVHQLLQRTLTTSPRVDGEAQ